MNNPLLIFAGKAISALSRMLNRGNGSTWPGHLALKANPKFIKEVLGKSGTKVIFVAGTNGKTTTSLLIKTILEARHKRVLLNSSGANLLNGIASSLILNATITGKVQADFAIFEVDENVLPHALKEITPDVIVLLDLFRDQLDRYGEVNAIADRWEPVLERLPKTTTLILNADDPEIAYLGTKTKAHTAYFGLDKAARTQEKLEHAVDSVYCPNCGAKLIYKTIFFSHLGDWTCPKCNFTHPRATITSLPSYPLAGMYNRYNTLAAVLAAETVGINETNIMAALQDFKPAFGRQETIEKDGKKVQVFLSKNPTGFNESLRTVVELGTKHILLALNDRIADGRDVSWIWDIDMDIVRNLESITITGDRAEDMGLRVKYALDGKHIPMIITRDKNEAVNAALHHLPNDQILAILPTYTAMLEIRKILTGKEIL